MGDIKDFKTIVGRTPTEYAKYVAASSLLSK